MFLFKRLVVFMAIAGLLAACGGKEERKGKYLERGKAYLEEGNLDKARIEFKNVAQIDPKSGQAYLYLGQIEEKEKAWGKAFGLYKRAIDLDPSLVEPRVTMAKLYLAQAGTYKFQGSTEKEANMRALGKEQIDIILQSEPANPEGLMLQASTWADEGEVGKAIDQIEKILSRNPDISSAAILLSAIYTQEGDSSAAEQVLLRALPSSAEPTNIRSRLVRLYLSLDKKPQAEDVLHEMVKNNPERLQYHIALATFLVQNEKPDDAEQVLRDAIAIDSADPDRYLLLSNFLSSNRSSEAAINELELALQNYPKSLELQFGLINLYQTNGQLDKVREGLEHIITEHGVEPAGLQARVAMVRLLLSENDESGKVNDLLSEVLTENPQDSSALLLRGRLAGQQEHWVDAINDFRSVLRGDPNSAEALKFLAAAHIANNEKILAKDTLKKALDVLPSDTSLRLQLVAILSDENNHGEALIQIDRVLEIEPENQQALNSKFNLLALKGDADGMNAVANILQTSSPESEDGFILEARLLFAQKDYEKSMVMAEDILSKNPSSIPALLLKSDIYANQKDYSNVSAVVKKIQSVSPDIAIGYYREAKLLVVQRKTTEAISVYEEALKKAPSSVEILTELTALQIQEGRTADAIHSLQNVLSENPGHPAANQMLGMAHVKNEDFAKAEEAFSRQIAINPIRPVAYVQLASSRVAQDNVAGAVTAYKEGLAAIPDDSRLMLGFAGLKEEQKKYDEAMILYEELLEKQPNNAVGINNLTMLLSEHKKDAQSMEKAVEYAKILEKAEQYVFKDTAAWAYFKSGDTAKALEIANEVIEKIPNVAIFNYHLGMIYLKRGDSAAARKYLTKAVSTGEFDGIDTAKSELEKL